MRYLFPCNMRLYTSTRQHFANLCCTFCSTWFDNKHLTVKLSFSAGAGIKGRSWKWKDILRFPQVSQCVDLAANLGVYECVLHGQQLLSVSFHIVFCFAFSIRERLPQSVCEAAYWQEPVSALLSESTWPAQLHISPECFGTLKRWTLLWKYDNSKSFYWKKYKIT